MPPFFSLFLFFLFSRYTAAGFSGRMPMAELADAIVESGRQTLVAAARMVRA